MIANKNGLFRITSFASNIGAHPATANIAVAAAAFVPSLSTSILALWIMESAFIHSDVNGEKSASGENRLRIPSSLKKPVRSSSKEKVNSGIVTCTVAPRAVFASFVKSQPDSHVRLEEFLPVMMICSCNGKKDPAHCIILLHFRFQFLHLSLYSKYTEPPVLKNGLGEQNEQVFLQTVSFSLYIVPQAALSPPSSVPQQYPVTRSSLHRPAP